MLMRQSNVSSDAPEGPTAISVVEPPPFFHGVVRQSPARMISTGQFLSARLGRSSLFSRAQSIARS